MTAMRISELSRRSGVPASTLCYYGQLGLLPAGAEVTPSIDGFAATLALEHATALTGLIVAEQSCCSFLAFTTGTDVRLTVTGPADAQPLIVELAGIPAKEHHP